MCYILEKKGLNMGISIVTPIFGIYTNCSQDRIRTCITYNSWCKLFNPLDKVINPLTNIDNPSLLTSASTIPPPD